MYNKCGWFFFGKNKIKFAVFAKAWYPTPLGPVVLSIKIEWTTKSGQSFFGKTMSPQVCPSFFPSELP